MNRRTLLAGTVLLAALGAAAQEGGGWTALIGDTLDDTWTQNGGDAKYDLLDGVIVGTAVPSTPNSFLCTKRHYGDFELEFEFKASPTMNSGVQIRSHAHDEETTYEWKGKTIKVKPGRVHGYQVELENENRDRGWSGGIYDEGRRGWLFNGADTAAFAKQGKEVWKFGDWNHVRVRCEGDRIRTWLNGEPRSDFRDAMTPEGFIGLQVHSVKKGGEGAQVFWRNLRIRELAESK